jgi:hypothetical protein
MSTESCSSNMSTRLIASRCFKLAALLNVTAIPGHHINALISVYPAVEAIPDVPQHAVGQRSATFGWDFLHSFFFVTGMTSCMIPKTGSTESSLTSQLQPFSTINGARVMGQEQKRRDG